MVRFGAALDPQLPCSGLEVGWAGTARPYFDALHGEPPFSIPQRWLVGRDALYFSVLFTDREKYL